MAHRNARLTPVTRLELVREVEAGWSQAEVARRFRVSRPTVAKWVRRFREAGTDGLEDRTSAPHSNPRRTSPELESRICAVRRRRRSGRGVRSPQSSASRPSTCSSRAAVSAHLDVRAAAGTVADPGGAGLRPARTGRLSSGSATGCPPEPRCSRSEACRNRSPRPGRTAVAVLTPRFTRTGRAGGEGAPHASPSPCVSQP